MIALQIDLLVTFGYFHSSDGLEIGSIEAQGFCEGLLCSSSPEEDKEQF
jgi:hypothetical protein